MNLERYLQKHFNIRLRIMEYPQNSDIDVLYFGRKRLCSIPKGLKKAHFFASAVSDRRNAYGYATSDNIQHRSWNGIGMILLHAKIITAKQFVNHFVTKEQKKHFMEIVKHEMDKVNPRASISYHYRKLDRDLKAENQKYEMAKRGKEAKKKQYEIQKIIRHLNKSRKKIAA